MFRVESGMDIIENATERYEKHFNKAFPLYEYIDIAEIDGTITTEGAKKLEKFIETHIEADEEVYTPEDYDTRLY